MSAEHQSITSMNVDGQHRWVLCAIFSLLCLLATTARAQVVINELMYHPPEPWPPTQPSKTTNLAEYVELYNAGTGAVDLTDYRFDNGIDYNFASGVVLAADAYLVVCRNVEAFTNAYPSVTNYLGNYDGGLNNGGERVTLSQRLTPTSGWDTVDTIRYADVDSSDGDGPSLELVNPGFAKLRDYYWGSWLPSTDTNGTPGEVNSTLNTNPAPVVGEVLHDPALPFPNSCITITAEAADFEDNSDLDVKVLYRKDALPQTNDWQNAAMEDTGRNGDEIAGDGIYTVRLPENSSGFTMAAEEILEFRVQADDDNGKSVLMPATNTGDVIGSPPFSYLCYFGDDTNYTGEYTTYHLILTATNAATMRAQTQFIDDQRLDGTFITSGGKIFYNCAFRHRGGSSTTWPFNFKVGFPDGMDLGGYESFNLNHVNALYQHIGMVIANRSEYGVDASDTKLCRVWVNNTNRTPLASQQMYVRSEPLNQDFADKHWNSENGNFYITDGDTYNGNLTYLPTLGAYPPEYNRKTNNPYTAWHDLSNLCYVVDQDPSTFPATLTNVLYPRQWARAFAGQRALDNGEAGVWETGNPGDEFRLYVGDEDGMFKAIPWDTDSLFDNNDTTVWGEWGAYNTVDILKNAPGSNFYAHDCLDIAFNVMSDDNVNALFDEMGSAVDSYRAGWLTKIQNLRVDIVDEVGARDAGPTAPTNLYLTNVTATSIELNWQDVGADEQWFEIWRSKDGRKWKYHGWVPANGTAFLDTDLNDNDEYFYKVRGVDINGESAFTAPQSVITPYLTTDSTLVDGLRITEIMYNPPGSDTNEFLEVQNVSGGALDLTGLAFSKGVDFIFTNGTTLGAGEFFVLVKDAAGFSSHYPGVTYHGVFENGTGLANSDDNIELTVGTNGAKILDVSYVDKGGDWYATTDGGGYSLVLTDPANTDNDPNGSDFEQMSVPAVWRPSTYVGGSPGSNDPAPPFGNILINEVLTHQDVEDPGDRIELFNPTTNSVNLSYWFISDSESNPKKYRVPAGITIGPSNYYVFNEFSGFGTNGPSGSNGFALSEFGDEVYLSSGDVDTNLTSYRVSTDFGTVENGVTFGRYTKSDGEVDFVRMSAATMSNANAYPMVGPIVINEIMYNPAPGGNEFIELLNVTNTTVNLRDTVFGTTNSWQLDGAVEFHFPTNASMAPGEYVLVTGINPTNFRAAYGLTNPSVQVFGPYDGDLGNGGESLKLYKPAGTNDSGGMIRVRIDRVKYDDNYPWPPEADNDGPSLERRVPTEYGNDPTNWMASTPSGTPGVANNTNGLPTLRFEAKSATGYETNETVNVMVLLSPAAGNSVTGTYVVTGTATNSDHGLVDGSIVFTAGQTSNTISLVINDDGGQEIDETVVITFVDATATVRLGGNKAHTYTIVDDNDGAIAPPVITPSGSNFMESAVVTMTSAPGTEIYYTIDGSTPTSSDNLYTNPFVLTTSARIKARAFVGTYNASTTTSGLFLEQAPPWDPGPGVWRGWTGASSDDATQEGGGGGVVLNGPTLGIGRDMWFLGGPAYGGVRFQDVALPPAATLTDAYLQFTSSSSNSTTVSVTIYGDSHDNAATFSTTAFDLSSRTHTTNSVLWSISPWLKAGDHAAAQRTPDIRSIVEEITSRPGWTMSNSIVFLLYYDDVDAGSQRDAYTWDGAMVAGTNWGQPMLHLEYSVPDSDGDGIPDSWEIMHFGSITNSPDGDPDNDFDGDGMVNSNEYIAGTIPTNSASVLQLVDVEIGGSNRTVYWHSVTDRVYSVYKTTNLLQGWPMPALTTNEMGVASGTNTFDDTNTSAVGFYRIGVKIP